MEPRKMPTEMKPLERVLTAIKWHEPDRVPIFELMIDPNIVQGILPGASYPELVEALDIDCAVSPTPSSMYGKIILGNKDGLPVFKTEWGETRATTAELVPMPIDHPLKTRKDWEKYQIPDPEKPGRFENLKSLVKRFKGQRAIGCHLHDSFNYPSYLFGLNNLMMNLIEDPGWVHEVVAACNWHCVRMVELAIEAGADFIVFGDDVGGKSGPLVSPKHYGEFFLPGLANVTQAAHNKGAFVIKHTDGNVYKLLDMFAEAGIDAFHPSDPSAGMDIFEVKQKYIGRLAVVGSVDVGDPLSYWPVDQLVGEIRRQITQLAPGGGWIIASSNTIHSSVRPENYHALITAIQTYGCYGHLNQPISPEMEASIGIIPVKKFNKNAN
jgi:uroporphyrinogen decarboxylase